MLEEVQKCRDPQNLLTPVSYLGSTRNSSEDGTQCFSQTFERKVLVSMKSVSSFAIALIGERPAI